ncbi:phage antirepressor [Dysosmobacter sp. Marseille-Q4140]|nr:phage antirepressor [Dysosmobacter sp. Marseille-Q4140]
MNQMEIFKNPEFGSIRAVEIDGEPWLVGKDVALALGYKNAKDALSAHVDAEDKRIVQRSENATFDIPNRGITIINESGLYSLVLSSKLPKAKQFRRWVTSEVLPSIRKHGAYMTKEKLWEVATSPEALMKLCSDLLAEREKNAALRADNARLKGKAAYYDLFIDLHHSTNLRTTAKELVVPERQFVRFLLEQRFVYRTPSGCVLPYAKSSNEGLFCVKDYYRNGHSGSYTLVTPKGKLYFADLRDLILVTV